MGGGRERMCVSAGSFDSINTHQHYFFSTNTNTNTADTIKSTQQDGLEETVIASVMKEVLSALAYVHKHSGIHRDVKVRMGRWGWGWTVEQGWCWFALNNPLIRHPTQKYSHHTTPHHTTSTRTPHHTTSHHTTPHHTNTHTTPHRTTTRPATSWWTGTAT